MELVIKIGRKGQLFGVYVTSSLSWAVCCNVGSHLSSSDDLRDLNIIRVGISRMGSGSHTMAFYMAKELAIDVKKLEFIVLNNFDGLRAG